jgi:hypothetical protein
MSTDRLNNSCNNVNKNNLGMNDFIKKNIDDIGQNKIRALIKIFQIIKIIRI